MAGGSAGQEERAKGSLSPITLNSDLAGGEGSREVSPNCCFKATKIQPIPGRKGSWVVALEVENQELSVENLGKSSCA